MYIKYNDKDYPCNCSINSNCITYRGLPEDFPSEITGEITLYADNGFKFKTVKVEDYLRYTSLNGTLTLTNLPEPEIIETPQSPSRMEQLRADIDFLAIMNGVKLYEQ